MNILIVDDHAVFRRGLRAIIQENHPEAHIAEARNGQESLDLLKKHSTHVRPDIVIMDLEMPEMDGIQTTTYLRSRMPDIKIIVMTMHEDAWFMDQLVGLGVQGYLVKGDHEERIEKALQAVWKGGAYFGSKTSGALQRELIRNKRFRRNFSRFRQLSEREMEVLQRICKEETNRDIAQKLSLSVRTVDNHRNKLLVKCDVKNTAGLVMYAIRHGLVDTADL